MRGERVCALGAVLAVTALLLGGCDAGTTNSTGTHTSSTTTQHSSTSAQQQPPASLTATASAAPGALSVSATAGGVTARMRVSGRPPTVGVLWPVHFTVSRAGRPARASVGYEFLLGQQVVAHRSHYTFTGSFSDTLEWPAEAVGFELTLRAVITAGRSTINLDYPVRVSR